MIRLKILSASKLLSLALFISIASALTLYLVLREKTANTGPERPKLQGRVVAVFNNTRYAHEVEGRVRFLLTAGVDKTYEDGTHELEQVRLESLGSEGERHDVVTSDRAKLSDPSDLNKLDAEFISNVVVQMSDGMTIKTAYLHYDHIKGIVDTKELVEFEGATLAGRSTGMIIETVNERAQLLSNVDVTIKPEGEAKKQGSKGGDATAKKQRDETPEQKAARKARKRARKLERKRAEAVRAEAKTDQQTKSRKRGASDKAKGPLISSKEPTRIRGNSALLEKKAHRVTFNGSVIVNQGSDEMRADRMIGHIAASNHIERIEARGSSSLRQANKAEIKSSDLDFYFTGGNQLVRAVASGQAHARSLGQGAAREASAKRMEATFVDRALDTIKGQGDAYVKLNAPAATDARANPSTRELAAEAISLQFFPDGENIKSAEATGNAVMTVTPTRPERGADKKIIRAPQMNAIFHEQGNLLKTYTASGGTKVEIEALLPDAHPPRVTTSEKLTAEFLSASQDLERITQEGDFKYNEGDRNAIAEQAIYNGQTEALNLRGKRPTVWDSKARTQADEIDYDRSKDQTFARGDVRTTYYSRQTAGDSTPFKNSRSPVFMTAERAEARNAEGIAIYTGNARGWQDDNFVKGDRIELYEKDKRMVAVGKVESALYQVRREGAPGKGATPGKGEAVPGFASADRMTYSDTERLVHYDGSVKARQGTDRIEASVVDVYLHKEANEVERLMAEGNVILTQPGRRGVGDKLAYTAEDGRAVLTGKSARIDDQERGTTMGSQLTFYSLDDKVFVDNQQGTGRVRSTHRLTKNK